MKKKKRIFFRKGPMSTFKKSNFNNSDIKSLPAKIREEIEQHCGTVFHLGNYKIWIFQFFINIFFLQFLNWIYCVVSQFFLYQ